MPDDHCWRCEESAIYDCISCGRPICEACSIAGPGWRFVCLDCPVPDDRNNPWSPEELAG